MAASDKRQAIDLDRAISGVLAILVADRLERVANDSSARRTDLLLEDAGLTVPEIAWLTGKTESATSKALQRARQGKGAVRG